MIRIENTEVFGLDAAIRGMRNPLESWNQSDSCYGYTAVEGDKRYVVGIKDKLLMKKLVNAGTDHSKFMRMITVICDIIAPLYWWKEFDTYRMGVEKNSCSTMHTLHKRDLTVEDFSMELICDRYMPEFEAIIEAINDARRMYIDTGDKAFWDSMIQLLPSSYNQKRTAMVSYQALRNMYNARKSHKLQEWRDFCEWCKTLPIAWLITGEDK